MPSHKYSCNTPFCLQFFVPSTFQHLMEEQILWMKYFRLVSFPFKCTVQHLLMPAQQNRVKYCSLSLLLHEIWIFRQLLLNWCGRLTILHFKAEHIWQKEMWSLWTRLLFLLQWISLRYEMWNYFIIWINQFAQLLHILYSYSLIGVITANNKWFGLIKAMRKDVLIVHASVFGASFLKLISDLSFLWNILKY